MTIWRELTNVPIGTRVRFNTDWDIFPDAIVPEGTLATITWNGIAVPGSAILEVLPDDLELRETLKEWQGKIRLYAYDSGTAHPKDDAAPIDIV